MFVEELELESAEQCTPHPQSNSVFAQFSAVCMFNWMLGQLRSESLIEGGIEKKIDLNRIIRKHLTENDGIL